MAIRPSATGNYARAGKAVADDAAYSFDAARTYSPKADEMVQKAAKLRAEENLAAMKVEKNLRSRGVAEYTKTKNLKTDLDAKENYKAASRKAGLLATAGGFLGKGIGGLGGSDRKRREVGANDDYYSKRIDSLRSGADTIRNTPLPSVSSPASTDTSTTTSPTASGSDGWTKLSKVLRTGEGTLGDQGYTTQFTGTQFSDISAHPRQIRSSGSLSSDAAGAYQFLSTTWDEAKSTLNLPDFSADSQEKAGRFLAERRGVNPDAVYSNIDEFKGAMDKLAPEWASMPYSGQGVNGGGNGSSYYGQGGLSLQEAWQIYNN
jgi:muramidase (phage lysozyme)